MHGRGVDSRTITIWIDGTPTTTGELMAEPLTPPETHSPLPWTAGDMVRVGIQSWAGLTWHPARVEKVCPKRVKVRWLDCSAKHGESSYVPTAAIRKEVSQ